ncbi:hypothetical protein DLAC_05516 [Tieghemostelium lacteum]|uniref:RGS domain-containing protein n=1 Tax=Tieghemostelium lacteum TaxID=361077 RepID=A0A151ZG19_TIELA|nr:hypothetical protein DLAC_05516 [Tieghemostelium lacteum]|eukprot:KYQ92922.1 hypothetical protein DLAC_05516 [Tieghemostelium lacteum]
MDSRVDVNSLGITSTLISKLFDSLSNSLDVALYNLMTNENEKTSIYSIAEGTKTTSPLNSGSSIPINSSTSSSNSNLMSLIGSSPRDGVQTQQPTSISSVIANSSSSNLNSSQQQILLPSGGSIKLSKSNTLIRKLATSGKILNLDQPNGETEWTNFARNFWFYYPSLVLISESSKYCKESAIKLILDMLPRHIQQLQSSSTVTSPSGVNTLSPTLISASIQGQGSFGRKTQHHHHQILSQPSQQQVSPPTLSVQPSVGGNSSSLVNILSSNNTTQTKVFSFESVLSNINSYHQHHGYNSDQMKYLDLIESTIEIVVADVITHILGKVEFGDNSLPQISTSLINRLRDLAFYYFKPTNARSLNFSTWLSLRLSISDQWSLILGQISRISLNPISSYLTKSVVSNPPLDDLLPLFKGIRWTILCITDAEKMIEVEKLIVQMLMWIEGNKKNVLRLAQLEALDGMLLSMNDYTQSSGIIEKMKLVYRRAEKLLKSDEFEEKSLKLLCTILTRGPNSIFEEEYDGIMKKLWKTISIQKKRDFSLECILRLLQGRFVPPRKITGLQTYLNSDAGPGTSIAGQLQQRLDRVYENSGSYQNAGLLFNRGKMIPRLQEVIQGLFGKKNTVPKIIDCIEILSAISVHISVHSLKLLTDSVLPTLFSSSSPLHHVIALRTLSIILDPTGVFWITAVSANSKSLPDNTYVKREEIQLTFETFLSKTYKFCEDQCGGESYLSSQDPLIISTQFEPTISLYSLISESAQHHHKFESETTVEAIKRWYEVCTKTPEQRDREFFDQSRVNTLNLIGRISQWERSNSLPGLPIEPYPMKKKSIKKKIVSFEVLELFKEVIRCTTFLPKSFILNSSLHKLVLHEEEEIATAASHAIQVIMCDHPEYRTTLVQGYTSLILQYQGKDHVALQTLLSQLLGLIDLWNERSFIESRHASVPLDSSFYPPKMLETEIEAIGLVHLTSPNPQTRLISLQLIRSISGIRNTETINTQIATILHGSWRTIVQRARHQLLLDNAYGLDKEIKLNPNDELPSAEEILSTNHDRLWSFVLSEIGRISTEHDCIKTLSKARGILLNIITNLQPIPMEQTTDEQKRYASYTLRYLWINCHALLFSICGISSTYPLKLNPQETDPIINDMIKFEHNFLSKVTNYLPNFWAHLLSDYSWIREKLSFICGLGHWRLIPKLIDSLNEWWTQNKQNKKLSRVRVDLSNIFRRISQHRDFPRALFESSDLIQIFVQFIQQIDPIFGDPTKLPSIHNASYFNDNAVVVYNFCNSLFTPTLCSLNGPIRRSLISNIKSIPWTVGERFKTFKAILQWSGHVKVSAARMQLEGIEVNKKLAKCKDSASREEERDRIGTELKKIRSCSRLAAESILKLGTIFEEGKLQNDVLDWVVDSELKGNRILRWVLSYHFDEAYVYFLNKSYTESNPQESVLYLHSIYDQFLPIPPANPPTLGITQDIYQFYFDKALEEKDQEDIEDEPLTNNDKIFSKKLIDIGSTLLFLSCLNLLHTAFLARIRSFDLMARLAPCAYGILPEENVSLRSQLLPKRQSFSSRNTPTNKLNAIEVSTIISNSECSEWTEKLFEEAFYRFPSLNLQNRKWTIQFLLPWCNNISFSDGTLHRFSPVGFLKLFFSVFTEGLTNINNVNNQSSELIPELIDLWLALAKNQQNLSTIVNFLIRKGIVNKESMPICRILILHCYRMDANKTLEPLIYQLTYAGVAATNSSTQRMSLEEMDLNNLSSPSNQNLNESNLEKKTRQSTKIREACAVIITDLISENMGPIMSHVHILFNYAILRVDSSESATLMKMINVLLSALRNNLYAQTFVDSFNKHHIRTVLKSFDTILTSIRLPNFQIKFDFTGTNQQLEKLDNYTKIDPIDTTIVSIYSKRKQSFLVQGGQQPGASHLSTSVQTKDSVIEHRDEMIKWCSGYIYVKELITVLCKYFENSSIPGAIDKWEAESLLWIKNYKDSRISIKACQMYRSIIDCQQQLPQSLTNVTKSQTLRKQKTRWASSVEHLVNLLQEWSNDLDKCVEQLSKSLMALSAGGSTGSSGSVVIGSNGHQTLVGGGLAIGTQTVDQHQQHQNQINNAIFKRTLCVEILQSLKQIISSKNIDDQSMSLIFCSSVAFLIYQHPFYKPLYETALDILNLLVIKQNILDDESSPIAMEIIKITNHVQIPRGIQYHLFKGLNSAQTEEICSQLLVAFFNINCHSLVDPCGSPQRYLLPILVLTPWLHNRILTSKSSIIYRELKTSADKVATKLSQYLSNLSELPYHKELQAIFKSYSEGGYNSDPDEFLVSVTSYIRPQCIPKLSTECADLIASLLESSQTFSNSIIKLTNELLEDAPIQVVPQFKNIIKVACEIGSSSSTAADLIDLVSNLMKTSSPNISQLPPYLPPIDKSPSDIISQIISLTGTSHTSIIGQPINSSTSSGISHPSEAKSKGHKRNKSPITNHPSLKEKALQEKRSQPVQPPKFSNVFLPLQQQQQQQQQHHNIQQQQTVQQSTISPSTSVEKDIEQLDDNDDDFDFDEFEEDLEKNLNNLDNSPNQKSMWRNSDEYSVYLDMDDEDVDENDLDDLKDGLVGLDANSLLSKFDSDLSKSVQKSPMKAQQQIQQPQQQTKPALTSSFNNNISLTSSMNNEQQDSIESLRMLLGSSEQNSSVKRLSGNSIQIDQLLSNLSNINQKDMTKLELDFDDMVDSPQSSFLNLSSSTNSSNSFSSSVAQSQPQPQQQQQQQPQQPTVEGIKEILGDSKRRRAFLDFLKKQKIQKAVNDVCFVEVVNDFKSDIGDGDCEIGGDGLLYLMRHIVEGFVQENAKHPISISDQVRSKVINTYQDFIANGNSIDPKIFDQALDMVMKALEDKSILNAFLQKK